MNLLGRINKCLAIGLLVSGTVMAAPAKALDGEEVVGVIIGLAALAALSNELNDDKDKAVHQHRYKPHGQYRDRQFHGQRTFHRRARVLPDACVRRVETPRGYRNILAARCLERNGIRTARLPDRCERQFYGNRGARYGYGVRCLRNAGFDIGRRHWR